MTPPTLGAKSSIIVLQALDLITTLAAFHLGVLEVNPLAGRLTTLFGSAGSVFFSKVIAVLILRRPRKLTWFANLFYVGVVWRNTFVLLVLFHLIH